MRRLSVGILCDSIELACSLEIIVGIGFALGHCLELTHHNLFYTVSKLCKSTRSGLVIGNNELVKCFLVDVCIKIILNSDIFHIVLLFCLVLLNYSTIKMKIQYIECKKEGIVWF